MPGIFGVKIKTDGMAVYLDIYLGLFAALSNVNVYSGSLNSWSEENPSLNAYPITGPASVITVAQVTSLGVHHLGDSDVGHDIE